MCLGLYAMLQLCSITCGYFAEAEAGSQDVLGRT